MEQNNQNKTNKTPIKIGLVDWIIILMACSTIALGAIYFIAK